MSDHPLNIADDFEPQIREQMTAAAMHGLATNPTLPIADRLGCALQALAWYEGHLDELDQTAAPTSPPEPAAKIAELRAELESANERIKVLLGDRDKARRLLAEHADCDDPHCAAEIALALGRPKTTLSVSVEPVPSTPRVIGYIVVIQDSTGHWCDDWDGAVHETLERGLTALAEARDSGDGYVAKLGRLTEVEETNDGD